MKYRVIGWTNYDDSSIKTSNKPMGYAERNAIIDDIRKNKYLFTGWHHQESWKNCVPVLNDGEKREFSQRGWGSLMAEAYGYLGNYDYSLFTFQESIRSESLSFPRETCNIRNLVFSPIEKEHFDVDVNIELFQIAKNNNYFYLEDLEELRYIDKNDKITLHCGEEERTYKVKSVSRNKKEVDFEKSDLINSKFKIIITYK